MSRNRQRKRIIKGETAMASEDPTRALTRVPQASDKATEIRTVVEALDKAPGIVQKLTSLYWSEDERSNGVVSFQEAKRFDFDHFVSTWKPVAERFQERRTLLEAF